MPTASSPTDHCDHGVSVWQGGCIRCREDRAHAAGAAKERARIVALLKAADQEGARLSSLLRGLIVKIEAVEHDERRIGRGSSVGILPSDPNDLLTADEHTTLNTDLAAMADQRRRVEAEGRDLPLAAADPPRGSYWVGDSNIPIGWVETQEVSEAAEITVGQRRRWTDERACQTPFTIVHLQEGYAFCLYDERTFRGGVWLSEMVLNESQHVVKESDD